MNIYDTSLFYYYYYIVFKLLINSFKHQVVVVNDHLEFHKCEKKFVIFEVF